MISRVLLQFSRSLTNQNINFWVNPHPSSAKMYRKNKFDITKEIGAKIYEEVDGLGMR